MGLSSLNIYLGSILNFILLHYEITKFHKSVGFEYKILIILIISKFCVHNDLMKYS